MTTTTYYYLGIDVHKTDAYIAVMDEEGKFVEEVRVVNADLNESAQKYEAAPEAGSNHFTIYDELEQYLGVTITIRPRSSGSLTNARIVL